MTFESAVEPGTRTPKIAPLPETQAMDEAGSLARPTYQHPQGRNGIDWIGRAQQGGGKVPDDFAWSSNPKQEQEGGLGS